MFHAMKKLLIKNQAKSKFFLFQNVMITVVIASLKHFLSILCQLLGKMAVRHDEF